ncbi:PTS ascorbate transporter subunit IIC [Allofustis seminis]|uniref:PTS ascorbate transporter subunit IIC n=1 Tax=Allofustis seminis TaxID=166939 RepID=UPI00036D477D|nr:PTS ascorbate transporter subunit IIC [Allofustis seminis]
MNPILEFIIELASKPAILVALIVVIGVVAQRKSYTEVITAGVKTFVGFLILTSGAGIIVQALEPFGEMFTTAFSMQGVVPSQEAAVSLALQEYGTPTALIMLLGMVMNVLAARFTKYKYIYLTGHATLNMSAMVAVILAVAGFSGISLILVGGVVVGLINTISPALLQKYIPIITRGNDGIALGHTGGLGYWISALVGHLVGNKEKSTEDIDFPKWLSFFRDSTVSIAVTMALIYIILAIASGSEYVTTNLSDGGNAIIYSLMMSGTFAAGVYIILQGVRMIIAEIVPAFKGISERIVPDAKPAIDVPVVFPYAPNAVLIGFLTSLLGGLVSMMIMIFTGSTVIIPGVTPHFFTGAAAGVFGNATGGVRGAVAGSFINGVVMSFLSLSLMSLMGDMGFANTTFGDIDNGVVGIIFGNLGKAGGQMAIVIGLAAIIVIFLLLQNVITKSDAKAE